jgi:hypothetical protein
MQQVVAPLRCRERGGAVAHDQCVFAEKESGGRAAQHDASEPVEQQAVVAAAQDPDARAVEADRKGTGLGSGEAADRRLMPGMRLQRSRRLERQDGVSSGHEQPAADDGRIVDRRQDRDRASALEPVVRLERAVHHRHRDRKLAPASHETITGAAEQPQDVHGFRPQ